AGAANRRPGGYPRRRTLPRHRSCPCAQGSAYSAATGLPARVQAQPAGRVDDFAVPVQGEEVKMPLKSTPVPPSTITDATSESPLVAVLALRGRPGGDADNV